MQTILALEELKELGYDEVWIGGVPNPHWPRHGCGNFVIAGPKKERYGWPALWSVSEKNFGKQWCGNGLEKADQVQRSNRLMPGHYKLTENGWRTSEDS